jgi:5,10-methylenetetrahydromethanopterin reductase
VTEIWTATVNNTAADIRRHAEQFESVGFDGCFMSDSQNIRMECWVALTVAALATQRLQLGTYVTNPVTRHVAVTAGAAATLQEVSGGRLVLGVGRGDSALANIGYGPLPIDRFERFLMRLQAYLRGDAVAFDVDELPGLPRSADLGYASTPVDSRIVWLPTERPKVPVNVVASGRRVLHLGARLADEVTLVIGADVALLRNMIDSLRRGRADAGLDPQTLALSVMLPVSVNADIDQARRDVSASLGEVARWMSLQHGQPSGLHEQARADFDAVVCHYDMHGHGPGDRPAVTNKLAPEVIDRYAIAGPPDLVAARVLEIMNLGFARVILPPQPLIIEEVLPALRRSVSSRS